MRSWTRQVSGSGRETSAGRQLPDRGSRRPIATQRLRKAARKWFFALTHRSRVRARSMPYRSAKNAGSFAGPTRSVAIAWTSRTRSTAVRPSATAQSVLHRAHVAELAAGESYDVRFDLDAAPERAAPLPAEQEAQMRADARAPRGIDDVRIAEIGDRLQAPAERGGSAHRTEQAYPRHRRSRGCRPDR